MSRRRSPEQYRRQGPGWPVNVSVRLRRVGAPTGSPPPTIKDAWPVVEGLAGHGRTPAGWEVTMIQWEGFRAAGDNAYRSVGWRPADGSSGTWMDLRQLLGPMMDAPHVLHMGRESVTYRKARHITLPRYRLLPNVRSSKYAAGQWVSDAYAARYPHLVRAQGKRSVTVYDDVVDYEFEVRADYTGD